MSPGGPPASSRAERHVPEVIGIDHIYVSVSELSRSDGAFYDCVLRGNALGFPQERIRALGGEPLTCSTPTGCSASCCAPRACAARTQPYAPGLHHF